MRKVTLFTLGMLAAGLAALPARAEVITSPTKALRLLTEARVAAQKCGYLTAAEREELTDYAAQAELAAVRRAGAEATRQALMAGKQRGSAGCSEEKRALVLAVLEGAREAARSTGRRAANHGAARRAAQREATRQARRSARRSRPRGRANGTSMADVRAYVALASAYYNALKCRNRPPVELQRMWQRVRRAHFDLLRKAGGAVVARAKHTAARRGNARACW